MVGREQAIVGCLLGTACGDALGLWCENMTPRRLLRWHAAPAAYHFLVGRGMISDDTEHLCMTAQALIVSAGEPKKFRRSLAWRLRFWLLGLPAGTGKATALALIKSWFGGRRGVFSAGNGPAMRSTILGVCFGHDPQRLRELVAASTLITHTDPRAEYGALAIAWATHVAHTTATDSDLATNFSEGWRSLAAQGPHDLLDLIERAVTGATRETAEFAAELGLGRGITGFVNHTVPLVLQVWLRHPRDPRLALDAIIRCGGDTDTTAAILGGIVGARVGQAGLPDEWLHGLCDWPRSPAWIARLGTRLEKTLAAGRPQPAERLFLPGLLARNLFFLAVVLVHGFRRLLPPY